MSSPHTSSSLLTPAHLCVIFIILVNFRTKPHNGPPSQGRTGRKKKAIDTTKDNFYASIVTEQPKAVSHRSRRQSRATRENVIESVIAAGKLNPSALVWGLLTHASRPPNPPHTSHPRLAGQVDRASVSGVFSWQLHHVGRSLKHVPARGRRRRGIRASKDEAKGRRASSERHPEYVRSRTPFWATPLGFTLRYAPPHCSPPPRIPTYSAVLVHRYC